MAATTRPIAKAVYVCDDVLPALGHQRLTLSGVMNAVRVPPGAGLPYVLGRMCVFAQLEDGAGDADFQVAVVSAGTGQVAFHSPVYRVRFPTRLTVVSVNVRLTGCPFPAAGEYWVELHCDGAPLGDRVLHVV
jgi:hypothetical protein